MREKQENWSGSDEEAQVMMAADAVTPWGKWTLVRKNDTTTLHRLRPFTLSEELREDARNYFTQIIKDFVDAPPWPADIEEWRVAYDPMRAAERWLTRKGYDPANISAANKLALAATMEIAGAAMIYSHGKAPGMPD